MSGVHVALPLYEITLIVGTAWVIYGLGYGRGSLRAYRRGMARQKHALARQQRANDVAIDNLAELQRIYVSGLRREHAAELLRVGDAAVAEALSNIAPEPRRRV